MKRIRIRMPAEATFDPSALAAAVRMVMAGGLADAKLWRPNPVPAIGQLEEGVYGEGVTALAELFHATTDLLDLPEEPRATAVMAKALQSDQPPDVLDDLEKALRLSRKPQPGQTSLGFEEEAHPREKAGETRAGYKPGEFVPKTETAAEAAEAAEERDEPVQEDEKPWTVPASITENRARQKQIWDKELDEVDRLRAAGKPDEAAALGDRLTAELNDLVEADKVHVARFDQQIRTVEDRFMQEERDRTAREKALRQLIPQAATEGEKKRLQDEQRDLMDDRGIARRRAHLQIERLKAERDGGEIVPLPDEMRAKARELQAQDKELNRALVPLSDPRREALRAEWQRLFTTADQREGMHSEYLDRMVHRVMAETSRALDPLIAERAAAKTEEERLAVDAKLNDLQGQAIDRVIEFQDRADWARQAEREKEDADLLGRVGQSEFDRIKREGREILDYQKAHQRTGVGYDERQMPARKETENSHKATWKALGRFWTDAECQAKNLPLGTRNLTEAEHQEAREHHYLGENFWYRGPAAGTKQQAEARRMMGRIQKRFPEWLRRELFNRGVEVHLTAASPSRIQFDTQAEFYQWLEQHPKLGNGCNPDLSGGVYYHSQRRAYAQIGESQPLKGDTGAGRGGTGSVNVECHEYAHAIDYTLRDDGLPIHQTPEWQAIHTEMVPHVDWYNKKPQELFAEGLTAFVESPALRKQMLEGPGPWRRMGEFFADLLEDPSAPRPKKRKTVRKALVLYLDKSMNTEPHEAPEETTEGGQPGIPKGWVWRSYELPAPNGDGVIILDGWGPPDEAAPPSPAKKGKADEPDL